MGIYIYTSVKWVICFNIRVYILFLCVFFFSFLNTAALTSSLFICNTKIHRAIFKKPLKQMKKKMALVLVSWLERVRLFR